MTIYRYIDSVELTGHSVAVRSWDVYVADALERIEQIATVRNIPRADGDVRLSYIHFQVEAEDLWDLHEKVAEIQAEVRSLGGRLLHDSKDMVVAVDVLNPTA